MRLIVNRLRFALAVLFGRLAFPAQPEGLILMADLAKTADSLTRLQASAARLVNVNATNASDLADAKAALANADDSTSSAIDAITAQIDAAAPPPADDPTAPVAE